MKKLIISSLIALIVGCVFLPEKHLIKPLEKSELNFFYEGSKQIIFSIPSGGINILSPVMPSYRHFNKLDIDSNDQDLIWLANITFDRVNKNRISGKYSIGLAAAGVIDAYNTELTDAKSLESYQTQFYKQEYGINIELHIVETGSYSWVTSQSANGNQVVVSAFIVLDSRHYLVFSFEYLGYDKKEIEKLQRIVNSTLESFKLKQI